MAEALAALVTKQDGADQRVAAAVEVLANAVWDHLCYEERVVLPTALWKAIADAFSANDDPCWGDLSSQQFQRTFERLAILALPSIKSAGD